MNCKKFLILFLVLGFFSCKNTVVPKNCAFGIVTNIKDYHHGHGIFSLDVYVDFEYENKIYKGLYIENFEGGYGSELFMENDSVVVKFSDLNEKEINKIYCSRMFFRKSRPIYRKMTRDSCSCKSSI